MPKIYVACLAAYNNGILHGEWIDAAQDVDIIREEIQEMLEASPVHNKPYPCEEWRIDDTEGFGGIELGWDLENISAIATAIEDADNEETGEAIKAWIANLGISETFDIEQFRDAFMGIYDSERAYVEESLEEQGLESELEKISIDSLNAWQYLDFDAIARDWFINSYWSERLSSGNYAVFTR